MFHLIKSKMQFLKLNEIRNLETKWVIYWAVAIKISDASVRKTP